VRNEIYPVLAGEGCECYLNGLTVLNGEQHVDNFTVIDHAMPHCFSREIYKGIYDDRTSGVFSGTIIVRPGAQKTNAIQSNNSILLSDDASIETKPQLKIWADDVKCTHGATVGQLDDKALFYLQARGIPVGEARKILIHAFASDVINHLSDEPLKAFLEAELYQALKF
jgi:Fe-S cluster assembly protein SufD